MGASLTTVLDMATVMALVVVVVTPLKACLEIWLPADNRAHDAAVQLLALAVGIVISLIVIWAEGPLTHSAQLEIVMSVLLGIGSGSAGIGLFHVATTITRSVPPPPPPRTRAATKPPAPPAPSTR